MTSRRGLAPQGAELVPLAPSLREALRAGYGWRDLRADLLSGAVVSVIALPLSMALAIATGLAPQYGLYTAIFAGGVIALLGGSRVQVSGPTAAFVVILAPIVSQYGLAGLATASMMAGAILILMGVARFGRLIAFVPYPVTAGFTAGIAVVIATLQLRDFLGLHVEHMPDHYIERVSALVQALPTIHAADAIIGVVTLAILIIAPRLTRSIPAALLALAIGTLVALGLATFGTAWQVDTIQSRFGGVPQALPSFDWPWHLPGPTNGSFTLNLETLRALLLPATAIAILGAIESLLSSVVAAGMSGTEHHPDSELVAQGCGNLVAPLFGGFAATGALARTAANVRNGARSPIAAVFHSVCLLASVLVLAPLLGYLPMAGLAALLLIVAWNMSEVRHVIHVVRVAPRSDIVVLLTCFGLTVVFDMTIAVSIGVVLAALLFMQRMAAVTGVQLTTERHQTPGVPLPPHMLVYEVAGPLFFGAAQRAMSALKTVDRSVSVVVLDLRSVPVMDATGLVNLESALDKLKAAGIYTVVAGVQEQPLALMAKAGWKHRAWLGVYRSFEHGLSDARQLGHLVTHSDAGKAAAAQ